MAFSIKISGTDVVFRCDVCGESFRFADGDKLTDHPMQCTCVRLPMTLERS